MTIDQLTSKALQLNPHDRAILAGIIWESLEDPYVFKTDLSDAEAIALSKKRDEEIDQGKVHPISHQELMDRLRNAD